MAISQKSVTIGEESFVIQSLPASKGVEAAVALSHILAGAKEGIGPTHQDFLDDTEINYGKFIAGMLERLDVALTPIFIKDLILLSVILPEALADKKQDWFEDKFAGNYEIMIDLIVAILEHNGFVDLLKKKAAQIMALL